MANELRRIIYDTSDVPHPTFLGGVLWVGLFFLPLPLMLLVHWYFGQQPPASIWFRLLSVLTFGDWRVGLVAFVTFSACVAFIAWMMRNEDKIAELVQACTDNAGLKGWTLPALIIMPIISIPLILLRKMGIVELTLVAGVEAALASARTIKRFPPEEVDLVPADLSTHVEELKKGKGMMVNFNWSFQPNPFATPESLSLQVAFSVEGLERAREIDHSIVRDEDLLRFVGVCLKMPEIFAIATLLHEEHQKRRWTPFQCTMNVLAMVENFAADEPDKGLPNRLPIETLYEKKGTTGDLVVAVATLLRALSRTVPETVLVVRGDGQAVALGIAGAGEMPKDMRGFEHEGEVYFFCLPQRVGSRWQWHVGQRLSGWESIRILRLPYG
ncbi:MAG: hypothetical protein RMK94_03470 [Armatimonadota bacterium]|nr:hypothetical protein [Armatimonadota bacterium]